MNIIVERIRDGLRLPINSAGHAIQAYNDNHRNRGYRFSGDLNWLLGGEDCNEYTSLEGEHGRIQVAYVIEAAVSAHLAGTELDVKNLYATATVKAKKLVAEEPWHFAKVEIDPIFDEDGNEQPTRQRKGDKQRRAAELYEAKRNDLTQNEMIELFVNDLEMSKAGARTYVYNNKKVYGPCKKDKAGRRSGPTKGQLALELYNENLKRKAPLGKDELIEVLMKELGTTKAGATTQYYAARKMASS